jgi:hypothetical protein
MPRQKLLNAGAERHRFGNRETTRKAEQQHASLNGHADTGPPGGITRLSSG